MNIHYVGLKNPYWDAKYKRRGAEIWSRWDGDDNYNAHDKTLFERTIALLKVHGWKFTEGIDGWAFCELNDRDEYNEFLEDYKDCKKCIANCMRFGF